MGRKTACAMFLAAGLIPAICGRAYGGDIRSMQLPAYYYRVDVLEQRKEPDPRAGFKKVRKQVSKMSALYLTKKMGENYFTQRIVPIVLDSWTQVFVPKKFGEISLRSPLWVVDRIADRIISAEKKQIGQWVEQVSPTLPVVGNIASDLLESQKLSFSNGLPHYQMRSKNRIAPSFQFGNYSFTGGTETRLAGTDLKGLTLVTAFSYAGDDESYGVHVFGKEINFKIDIPHFKANVTWDPDGVEFKVDLTFGQ